MKLFALLLSTVAMYARAQNLVGGGGEPFWDITINGSAKSIELKVSAEENIPKKFQINSETPAAGKAGGFSTVYRASSSSGDKLLVRTMQNDKCPEVSETKPSHSVVVVVNSKVVLSGCLGFTK